MSSRIASYGSLGKVPAAATPNLRNDMYLVLDTTKLIDRGQVRAAPLHRERDEDAQGYQTGLEQGTRYIPPG